MKATATMLDGPGQDDDRVSPPRRGKKLTLAGAACALAAAALTFGAVHHSSARSVRPTATTVQQGTNVVDSPDGLGSGPDGTGNPSLAAPDAGDIRTAIEVDGAAANARLHDMRDEREAARAAVANDDAAGTTPFAGSGD